MQYIYIFEGWVNVKRLKQLLIIGGLAASFIIGPGSVISTHTAYAFNADDAEDVVYTMYSGAVVYDVDYDKYYDEYEVYFESDEYEYGSSVIVDKYGDIVDEYLYYRDDEEDDEEDDDEYGYW